MNQYPHVAAVVVNWNMPEITLECLSSLRASTYPNLQLILVDNGSNVSCLEQLRVGAADCSILTLPNNRGFAAAANVGMRYAMTQKFSYVLLVNNDAIVAPNMLSSLILEAQSTTRAGIVAPLILYESMPDRIWRFGDRESPWFPIPIALWRDMPYSRVPPYPVDVDYVTGCGMLLRRELIEQTQGFDERFVMYYEDADLCLRVRQKGYRIRVVPTATMWHKVSQSARMNRSANAFLWMYSRVIFYRNKVIGRQRVLIDSFLLATAIKDTITALVHGEKQVALSLIRGIIMGYTYS